MTVSHSESAINDNAALMNMQLLINLIPGLKWRKKLKINWKRVATTSLFGFAFVGPVGHFWYESLDRFIRSRLVLRPNSLRFVGAKVALDGVIFGPLDLLVFFSYMGFASGKSVPQIKEDLKRDFVPALILEGVVFYLGLSSKRMHPWKQWLVSLLSGKEKPASS
ncbi:PEROXISOMAL MEMBRANE 22 KDA (MPV17/PMP22) FAMILY PROTEIN [Salix purpurea]|uniref:PEROXISOMAL MEMBRANE 22 kDa (MPV17/PMP22) FAMILY PROTEIN n=1 Tax=Salix purpurea TaxID=77065 RepID=A0A9Q0ULP9_SALPP|nr:PEROXISOMAL MEMBRANE 22 KDA (MPV17/PMP22) FAMILY PROTEIN [Salix purpurea]